jgi:hypothetical protein
MGTILSEINVEKAQTKGAPAASTELDNQSTSETIRSPIPEVSNPENPQMSSPENPKTSNPEKSEISNPSSARQRRESFQRSVSLTYSRRSGHSRRSISPRHSRRSISPRHRRRSISQRHTRSSSRSSRSSSRSSSSSSSEDDRRRAPRYLHMAELSEDLLKAVRVIIFLIFSRLYTYRIYNYILIIYFIFRDRFSGLLKRYRPGTN